jgi:hypothetical protein
MSTAHLFPRMYDNGNERQQEFVYREFGGVGEGEEPTEANEIRYFADYQFRWMYWRYFMWNFAGKQNDLQGFGNIRDGNWYCGIKPIDKFFHSTTDELPATAGKDNKANNQLFFLPLILGIVGVAFQYKRDTRDFFIAFLLFFFTGFAVVIYLNQSGYQPRERDYAYVGSFYAFAIWIGLGVLWVQEKLSKYIRGQASSIAAFAICALAVPVLMASQEWNDHDRSKKYLARDLGTDYMQSCEKDAILLTFGDNDTYPLWYAQEVEGIRPDLRVINYSLLGTDWYINQLRYKLNQSAPTDVIFTEQQIQGNTRNVIPVYPLPGYDQNKYYNLDTLMRTVVSSDDPAKKVSMQSGDQANVLPVKKLSIPVDVEAVKKLMKFNPGDSIVSELKVDITRNFLQKNDLAVLSMIAANNWKRPIYFTSTQELKALGLEKYIRLEGLSYRLVPVENSGVETEIAYRNIMEKFRYGNGKTPGVYFDEENRRHINSIRLAHATLAKYLNGEGNKDSARKVLEKYDQNISEENVPYGMTSNRGNFHNAISSDFLEEAYKSGAKELAGRVNQSLKKDLDQEMVYYRSLGDEDMSNEQMAMQAAAILNNKGGNLSDRQRVFAYDILSSYQILEQLKQWEVQYNKGTQGIELRPDSLQTPKEPARKPDKP